MAAVTIRPVAEADRPAVSRVVCAAFCSGAERMGYSEAQIAHYVEQRGSIECIREQFGEYDCLVACIGDAVVGVIATKGNEITKFFIAPAFQRRGIGTVLFRAAERAIAAAGYDHLWLGCLFPQTRSFYEAMGMTVTGTKAVTIGPMAGERVTLFRKQIPPEEPGESS